MPNESYDWEAAQARLEAAAEAAGEAPPAWLHNDEPGAQIVGRLVAVNPSAYTAHGNVPVVTLEGPNGGRRSVWLHHAVLRRGFERANVQLGEVVLVRFVGKVSPAGGGNAWHDYRVAVDREASAAGADWAAIAKAHGDDAELAREAEQRAVDEQHDAALLTGQQQVDAAAAADDDIPF